MRRREFIALLGGVAAAWPISARAQKSAVPVIGFLSGASIETLGDYVTIFKHSLANTGFADGRNVAIEYRWAEGHNDRLTAMAADLVSREVAIIVAAASTPATLAAMAATQKIPIVFFVGTDPVKVGLVASLAHPGGNVTGVTILTVELLAKSLQLMHSLMPPATTIAVLINPANAPQSATERGDVGDAARILGAHFVILNASSPSEIEAAFAKLAGEGAGALVVTGETFFLTQRDLLVELAARYAMPTMYGFRDIALAGGLMSYAGRFGDGFREVGLYTGRILKGEKPADLPVIQSTKLELIINLKTAKALGLSIPLTLTGRADELIE